MIGYLRGVLREKEAGRVVLDVGGVGYVLRVPMSTFLELPAVSDEAELLVNTVVREDAITLHGFRTHAERELFERLLTVSGVGPRTALAALSALGAGALATSIVEGDARRLASVPGIGKKTAERIIIDLRDRVVVAPAGGVGAPIPGSGDVVSALVNLGYPDRQAVRVVADVTKALGRAGSSFEAVLREALSRLGRA